MARRDGVFADFEIHLAGTLPGIEERRGVYRFGAGQDGFLFEHQRSVNNFVANNGEDRLANLDEGGGKFTNESGRGERVSGNDGYWMNQESKKRGQNENGSAKNPEAKGMPDFISIPHLQSTHCGTSKSAALSNLALRGREDAGAEQKGSITLLVKNYSNAFKKSLAFIKREGVASASVQGLKLALSSLDGEVRRDFQKLVWSDSAECGSWRCGSASGLHGL
jgi:hypothetical protein